MMRLDPLEKIVWCHGLRANQVYCVCAQGKATFEVLTRLG
jgi:hypothetical protein